MRARWPRRIRCVSVVNNLAVGGSTTGPSRVGPHKCDHYSDVHVWQLGRAEYTTVHCTREELEAASALYPSCGGGAATTLYVLGCTTARQRAEFSGSYSLDSDDPGYSLSGTVDLLHSDVAITLTNLQYAPGVTGARVALGTAAGAARFAVSLLGSTAEVDLTISDSSLSVTITPSIAGTVVTTATIAVQASFSGLSCTYSDSEVRNNLGLTVQEIAEFELGSATYAYLISVDDSGVVTANATHWAKAHLVVSNRCNAGQAAQTVTTFVNTVESGPGGLDLGESSQAPLQAVADGSLTVKLWFNSPTRTVAYVAQKLSKRLPGASTTQLLP